MKRKISLTGIFIAIVLAGCGQSIYPDLPKNAVAFDMKEMTDKVDDALYGTFEYNGCTYIGYGTLAGTLKENDIEACVGYLVQNGEDSTDYRVYTLSCNANDDYLMLYVDGVTNQCYTPTYYVHNLCNEFPYPTLTMTLPLEGRMIKPEQHDAMYLKEAESLVQKAYIPIDDIIAGYERYFKNPILDSCLTYEDFALICGWTKEKSRIQYALNTVYEQLKLWPEERYFSKHGGFKRWFDMLEERTWDGDELNRTFENELLNHKLTKIPERKIIV